MINKEESDNKIQKINLKTILYKFKKKGKSPNWLKHAITKGFYQYIFNNIIINHGTHIMEEDWDNLIILDACRYDLYKKNNNLSGNLEYRISRGSSTHTFLKENFGNKKYYDTIYITANPVVNALANKIFYKIVSVWKDGWDNEFGTVLPRTMVKYTLKTANAFPNKRLIIHFVQPHYPFIGELRKKIGYERNNVDRVDAFQRFWEFVRDGKVDNEIVRKAYEENFNITLPYVKKLVEKLKGKTVISADHGNLFGERIPPFFFREYGHPADINVKYLLKVPWFVIENKNRKKIIEEKEEYKNKIEQNRIRTIAKHLKNI